MRSACVFCWQIHEKIQLENRVKSKAMHQTTGLKNPVVK